MLPHSSRRGTIIWWPLSLRLLWLLLSLLWWGQQRREGRAAVEAFILMTPYHRTTTATTTTRLAFSSISSTTPPPTTNPTSKQNDDDLLTIAIVGAGPSGLVLAHKLFAAIAIANQHRDDHDHHTSSSSSSSSSSSTRSSSNKSLFSNKKCNIYLIEARSVPRLQQYEQGRAYALGVGIRGRSAIASIDSSTTTTTTTTTTTDTTYPTVWKAVQQVGFASEKFDLHVGPFKFRLRDTTSNDQLEPSLLLFQSDLCATLLQELLQREQRQQQQNTKDQLLQLHMHFDTAVTSIDLLNKVITCQSSTTTTTTASSSSDAAAATTTTDLQQQKATTKQIPFDLVVGCDGVNSIVRSAIDETCEAFETTQNVLPGQFKTVRLPQMPGSGSSSPSNNKLDPDAVALILPKAGTTTAFVEPTIQGTCCVLFAGSNTTDPILASNDVEELRQVLQERFPFLLLQQQQQQQQQSSSSNNTTTVSLIDICAQQLAATSRPSTASSVTCNTYHYDATAVLVGDAAHATGGVSGQGVNSALVDSQRLADALIANYFDAIDNNNKTASLHRALLTYSQQQVSEGKALYELSFPPPPTTARQRFMRAFKTARDTIFGGRFGIGRPPIQTVLTTSLQSFADIRRNRQSDYPVDQQFPDQAWWNATLAELDAKLTSSSSSSSSSTSSAERATT